MARFRLKNRRTPAAFLLLLLAFAGGGLFVSCGVAVDNASYPLTRERLREGMAHCSACAVAYAAASKQAAEEEREVVCRLFAAMARVEQIQANHYASALHMPLCAFCRYDCPPAATERNLEAVLLAPAFVSPLAVREALDEGHRYAARLLIRHAASDNRLRRAVELLLGGATDTSHYLVCPRCAYLCDDAHADPYCPQCLLAATAFSRF